MRESDGSSFQDKLYILEVNTPQDESLEELTSYQATSIGLMGIATFGGFFVQVENFIFIRLITFAYLAKYCFLG